MDKHLALSELHCGMTFGFYARNGYYSSAEAFRQVDEMAQTGVRWVCVVATVMQEGFSATRQFRDFERTPNDLELKGIIDYIHEKGMRVQLRPMLECYDGLGRLAVTFPADGERIPGLPRSYASRWFESMRLRSVYYARLAEMTGCEMFCLDSELNRIVSFNEEWKRVIREVRAVYSGALTSCHTLHTRVIDFEKALSDRNHWFYDLDLLSISDYIRCANRPGLSAAEMAGGMEAERALLRRIAALYQKPILLGETGCTSSEGGAMNPSGWAPGGRFDGQEQANYLEALIASFRDEPWWYGLYWWKWDEQNFRPEMHDDPSGDKGFTVSGKPAQQVMRRLYGECPKLR